MSPNRRLGYYFNLDISDCHIGERRYLPVFGRFASSDPIGVRGGPNLFAYVLNQPVNYVDPTGLKCTATCHRNPNGDYVGGRGTFRVQFGAPGKLGQPTADDLASTMILTFDSKPGAFEEPRPLGAQPPCCCCCDKLGYIQIGKKTLKYFAGFFYDFWDSSDWGLDRPYYIPSLLSGAGYAYPFGSFGEPCSAIGGQAVLDDTPGTRSVSPWASVSLLARRKVQMLSQQFESCLVCLCGIEAGTIGGGSDAPYPAPVVYGCVTWSHLFTLQANGDYTVERTIGMNGASGGVTKVGYYDSLAAANKVLTAAGRGGPPSARMEELLAYYANVNRPECD